MSNTESRVFIVSLFECNKSNFSAACPFCVVLIVEVLTAIHYKTALLLLASHSSQQIIPSVSMRAEKVISCP
jgi:hypothetical protein